MKFFKAFNLLHRRTKSETFIPGFIAPQSVLVSTDRPSSFPGGLGSNAGKPEEISSLFDFATSKSTSVPLTFSHLWNGAHTTNSTNLKARQTIGRDSQGSMPSLLVEENMRLRETLDLWFQEYSKVDELLQKSRSELAFERERIRSLQQAAFHDQEVIVNLRKDLARYRGKLNNSTTVNSPCYLCDCRSRDPGSAAIGSISSDTLLLPAPSKSASSLTIPGKPRTLGDYTSALRLTLTTRRQLRDQKKVAKFWKTTAFSIGKCDDIITPSTSAISSVYEPLPPGRRAVVETFMQQRGLPLPQTKVAAQVTVEKAPKLAPLTAPASDLSLVSLMDTDLNVTRTLDPSPSKSSAHCIIHSSSSESGSITPFPSKRASLSQVHPVSGIAQTLLASLSSGSSVAPRLAPLASESLKAEINLFFGIQDSMSRQSPTSKKRQLDSIVPVRAVSPSSTMGPSSSRLSNILRTDDLNFSFGSYGELNLLFSGLFFPPRVKLPTQVTKDSAMNMIVLPTTSEIDADQALNCQPLLSPSPSLADSKVANAALLDLETPVVLHSVRNIDQRSKMTRPSGRSWQKYLAPAPNSKSTGKQKVVIAKKVAAGKENTLSFAKPLGSLFRKPF